MWSTSSPPPAPGRQAGYLIAVAVNTLLWFGVNVWPGWNVVPVLTEDFGQVVPLVNAILLVGIFVNLFYAVRDPAWLKALGALATDGLGIAGLVMTWEVFPFDLTSGWATLTRVVLIVGMVGCAIDIVVQAVRWISASLTGGQHPTGASSPRR